MLDESISFTFHSGYILIEILLFITLTIRSFTFHSGYILMLYHISFAIRLFPFTFHSGYILMSIDRLRQLGLQLYIPFWLYSNINPALSDLSPYLSLYIPFWLYSNLMGLSLLRMFVSLHSILVIF